MHKRLQKFIYNIIPSLKERDGFSLDAKSLPEKLFYKVVDKVRSIFNSELDREKDLYFDQFVVDTIIFFCFFYALCYFFYILPMEYFSNDPSKNIVWSQMFVLILLCSLLWADYVYIIQSFKNLTREKFIPVIDRNPQTIFNYQRFFRQFFEGFRIEWNSGLGLNIYIRSLFLDLCLVIGTYYVARTQLMGLISGVLILHSPEALLSLYLSGIILSIVAIVVYLVFLTLLTIPVIFIYLLIAIRFLPLEINIFHDMGGTEKFGKIIIHCIYLVSLALGMIPIISLIGKLDFSSVQIPIPKGNVGNATILLKTEMAKSVNAIPIDSFSKYFVYMEWFFIFIMLALLVILALHYHIKRKKEAELIHLEQLLSNIDLTRPENMETHLYYMSLYEKVSSSSEWPIKRIFVLELIISALPLFVSIIIR